MLVPESQELSFLLLELHNIASEEQKEKYKILFSLKAMSLISDGIRSDFITNSFSIYKFTMVVSYPLWYHS